jgi:TonB-linked SusC/RagA family outer membrane protein
MKIYTRLSDSSIYLYRFAFLQILLLSLLLLANSASASLRGVSIQRHKISIAKAFEEIEKQTTYHILLTGNIKDLKSCIKISLKDADIKEAIKSCLINTNLDFTIYDKYILITNKKRGYYKFNSQTDSIIFRGRVLDENRQPLSGATIKLRESTKSTFSSVKGEFAIYASKKSAIIISYLGYLNKEVTLNGYDSKRNLVIQMVPGTNVLGEVNVVSTGYQEIAKERATGSFEVITKEQLQHTTDPNLLRRLEGITTSINFNNQLISSNSANTQNIGGAPSILRNLTIRGATTFSAQNNASNQSGVPLVVIDGIASPYSIDFVNPNDVESITILKDAASASIWGSRAANGVIVVKTKRGTYEKPITVSFNSNFNITDKLDLFYQKTMSVSEYIDAQIRRFNNNGVTLSAPVVNRPQRSISPVDEILGQQKAGQITAEQATIQLNALRGNDIRNDYTKFFLRNAVRQSYSLSFDGGNKFVSYRLSGAYDKTLNNTQNSDFNRASLNYSTSLRPFKNLELTGNIGYSIQRNNNQAVNNRITGSTNDPFYPYTRLVDDAGNSIAITKNYRPAWVDLFHSTYGDRVFNLNYVPLSDINEGYEKVRFYNININLTAAYKILPSLSANITYNYSTGNSAGNTFYTQQSYFMRDRINMYTSPGTFIRNFPVGGQLSTVDSKPVNQTVRALINYNKNWNDNHGLAMIIGTDVAQSYTKTVINTYYGYNEENLMNVNNLPYNTLINPLLYTNSNGTLFATLPSLPNSFSYLKVRTVGVFSNAAYTYKQRYTISGSVRKDASSEFGVGTNKRGTPFYSGGLSWNIAKESFYDLKFLPRLQLRGTFGYNGNVNPRTSANPFIGYSTDPGGNGLYYAEFLQSDNGVSNSKLRAEKTGVFNIGLDYGFTNNRISGAVEYYDKKTTDLITGAPVDPTTGFSTLLINTGNIHAWGMDFTLNSINIQKGKISWTSNFLFSYNRVKVTKLYTNATQTAGTVILGVGPATYNVGYDLSRVFAFRWAGLDPVTGDPRGYLNGQIVSIANTTAGTNAQVGIEAAPVSTAKYFGSAVPVYFGSLRNTFSYAKFSISANIMYKLGYYFKRGGITGPVSYISLFNNRSLLGEEYSRRWQKPGDELYTNVPSLTFPLASNRDSFYANSEINVLKGDHIRLQEVNLSYAFDKRNWHLRNSRLFFNVSNLGVLWRANKLGIDPDTFDYPIPRTYSFGFSTNF